MFNRTDLALEACEGIGNGSGVEISEKKNGRVTVTSISITSETGARAVGRPVGRYITVSFPPLTDNAAGKNGACAEITGALAGMLPEEGTVLVAGLGSRAITPDALGPRTADRIPATRHIIGELRRSMGSGALRPTAVFSAGVLGQTGVESAELIRSLCRSVEPAAVICIDALASRSLSRLGRTVQLCDTGIAPGAGVGNDRPRIDAEWLGVPVIAVGVPTVVDADTLAREVVYGGEAGEGRDRGETGGMIVTPREIDLLIDRASRLLALAVNGALHPDIDPAELADM